VIGTDRGQASAPTVRLLLLNRFPFHEAFAAQLLEAAAVGYDVTYLGRSSVTSRDRISFSRIRTEQPRWRRAVPPIRAYWLDHRDRHRWQPALADADAVIDLYLQGSLWVLATQPAQPRVRILHRSAFLDPSLGERHRVRLRRSRLRRVVDHGDIVVVHTKRAAQVVGEFLPAEAVRVVPRLAPPPVKRQPSVQDGPPRLLFVGDRRHEKGYDLLLEAVRSIPTSVELLHVGSQEDVRAEREPAVQQVGRSVVRVEGRVTDAQLSSFYARADLVICPYRRAFSEQGAASSVVMEALAHGAPLIVSEALAVELPAGLGGVVVAPNDDGDALAGVIQAAIDDLTSLARRAAVQGPKYALTCGPSAYLAQLLAASGTPAASRSDR
jgi:glycosyltransferase involved in cell wall biosynthesis